MKNASGLGLPQNRPQGMPSRKAIDQRGADRGRASLQAEDVESVSILRGARTFDRFPDKFAYRLSKGHAITPCVCLRDFHRVVIKSKCRSGHGMSRISAAHHPTGFVMALPSLAHSVTANSVADIRAPHLIIEVNGRARHRQKRVRKQGRSRMSRARKT